MKAMHFIFFLKGLQGLPNLDSSSIQQPAGGRESFPFFKNSQLKCFFSLHRANN